MTKSSKFGVLAGAVAAVLALSSCGASLGNVDFRCASSQINGGLLLTVDVIRATDDEARMIQQEGEKWFYNQMRLNMTSGKRKTVTFPAPEPGQTCDRVVAIEANKAEKKLVVIADYKFQSPDPQGHIVVLDYKAWVGRTIKISVQEQKLFVSTQ